jgi:Leucine-rich repeat (LRR) protein
LIKFQPSTHIFKGIGENFPELRLLDIIQQKIKFVEREDFVGLKELERLNFQYNTVEFLPEDAFLELTNLKELNIYGNQIKEIAVNSFRNLQKIELIRIDDNKIDSFPVNLFENSLKLLAVSTYGNRANLTNFNFEKIPNVKLYNESSEFYYQRGERIRNEARTAKKAKKVVQ